MGAVVGGGGEPAGSADEQSAISPYKLGANMLTPPPPGPTITPPPGVIQVVQAAPPLLPPSADQPIWSPPSPAHEHDAVAVDTAPTELTPGYGTASLRTVTDSRLEDSRSVPRRTPAMPEPSIASRHESDLVAPPSATMRVVQSRDQGHAPIAGTPSVPQWLADLDSAPSGHVGTPSHGARDATAEGRALAIPAGQSVPHQPTGAEESTWELVTHDGTAVTIEGADVTVGRIGTRTRGGSQVGIVDPTKSMSKLHARLTRVGDKWLVSDLGSTNGTRVRDGFGEEREVPPGAVVEVTGLLLLGEVEVMIRRSESR